MTLRKLAALLLVCAFGLACRAHAAVAVNMSAAVLFSENGETLIPAGTYERITQLSDSGLFAARSKQGTFCLVDDKGNALTESLYTDAAYSNGRLILCEGGRYGVTDMNLNTVVPFEYSYLSFADAGRYLALKGDMWDDIADMLYLADEEGGCLATGTRLMYPVYALLEKGSACLSGKNGRWGYISETGSWKRDAMFLGGGKMTGGMAAVTLSTGSGVINENGDWLITPFCDDVVLTEETIVTVKAGIIDIYTRDSEGCQKVFTTDGTYAGAAGRYACLYRGDDTFVYDTATAKGFKAASHAAFSAGWNGMLICSEDNGVYLTDGTGKRLSEEYVSVGLLCEGYYCAYAMSDGYLEAGVMTCDGSLLTECCYNKIISPAAGYIAAEDDGGIYLFRTEGEELVYLAG